MTDDSLNYPVMVSQALRGVVRQALSVVERDGLPGNHHLFISFLTTEPGVVLPDPLLQRYPEEMTVVFQHRFWDLAVEEDRFRVGMSFHGNPHHIEVPFAAVTAYSDPSVPFGLRFDLPTGPEDGSEESAAAEEGQEPPADNVIRFDRPRRR